MNIYIRYICYRIVYLGIMHKKFPCVEVTLRYQLITRHVQLKVTTYIKFFLEFRILKVLTNGNETYLISVQTKPHERHMIPISSFSL